MICLGALKTISTAVINSTYRHLLGKFKLWKPNEILNVDGEVFSLLQQGLSANKRWKAEWPTKAKLWQSRGSALVINRNTSPVRAQSMCWNHGTKWQFSSSSAGHRYLHWCLAVFNRTPGVDLTGPCAVQTHTSFDSWGEINYKCRFTQKIHFHIFKYLYSWYTCNIIVFQCLYWFCVYADYRLFIILQILFFSTNFSPCLLGKSLLILLTVTMERLQGYKSDVKQLPELMYCCWASDLIW